MIHHDILSSVEIPHPVFCINMQKCSNIIFDVELYMAKQYENKRVVFMYKSAVTDVWSTLEFPIY